MRQDWTTTRLGDLVTIKHGWPFKSEHFSESLSGRPIVVAVGNFRYEGGFRFEETAMKEYRDMYPEEYELAPGDILLVMTCQTPGGEILGIPARVPDDGKTYLHNQRLGKVENHALDLIDDGFLYYLFKSRPFNAELCATASGTKILHTAPSRIEAFTFACPPIDEQRAIADVLGALDDKIEQNRRTAMALERLARTVFRAWFVDFEPVKAKAAGAAAFPSMPQEIFDALPTRLVDSELGPVPEGWEVAPMAELAEASKGLSYKGAGLVKDPAQVPDALPLHSLNAVYEGGGYKYEGIKYYAGEFKPRHIVKAGDIIIANTEQGFEYRLIGFPAIVPKCFGPQGLFTHHIFRLRPRDDSPVGKFFLYYALMGGRVRDEVCGCTNGTTVNALALDGLQRPLLCLPQSILARLFEAVASAMQDHREALFEESRKLAELRDYLLPKLLSGSVRVREAERPLADASGSCTNPTRQRGPTRIPR